MAEGDFRFRWICYLRKDDQMFQNQDKIKLEFKLYGKISKALASFL